MFCVPHFLWRFLVSVLHLLWSFLCFVWFHSLLCIFLMILCHFFRRFFVCFLFEVASWRNPRRLIYSLQHNTMFFIQFHNKLNCFPTVVVFIISIIFRISFHSTSVSDPDPGGSWFKSPVWIRIWIRNRIRIRIEKKTLDPDPQKTYPDPKHCIVHCWSNSVAHFLWS